MVIALSSYDVLTPETLSDNKIINGLVCVLFFGVGLKLSFLFVIHFFILLFRNLTFFLNHISRAMAF